MVVKKLGRLRKLIGAETSWLAFALLAMVLFSLGNLILKMIVAQNLKIEVTQSLVFNAVVLFGIFAAAVYFFILKDLNMTERSFTLLFFMILLSAAGFAFLVMALRQGQVAIVTAILSLSTVLLVVLSAVFFGDTFSVKEYVAVFMALVAVLVLII